MLSFSLVSSPAAAASGAAGERVEQSSESCEPHSERWSGASERWPAAAVGMNGGGELLAVSGGGGSKQWRQRQETSERAIHSASSDLAAIDWASSDWSTLQVFFYIGHVRWIPLSGLISMAMLRLILRRKKNIEPELYFCKYFVWKWEVISPFVWKGWVEPDSCHSYSLTKHENRINPFQFSPPTKRRNGIDPFFKNRTMTLHYTWFPNQTHPKWKDRWG